MSIYCCKSSDLATDSTKYSVIEQEVKGYGRNSAYNHDTRCLVKTWKSGLLKYKQSPQPCTYQDFSVLYSTVLNVDVFLLGINV